MTHFIHRLLVVPTLTFAAALFLNQVLAQSVKEGWFGVEINAVPQKGSLIRFNPVVESITITKVTPGSPAGLKGVAVGDQVIAVDGMSIAGRKLRELVPHTQKTVGQSIHLRLKKTNGKPYAVVLVAVARPKL